MASLLEAHHLKKRYVDVVAVDGVSFSVEAGTMTGLLGPNGAGKTTTVSMLAGLLRPDAGEVMVDGRRLLNDNDPAKGQIGVVPQDLALYEELTADNNLALFGALYGLSGRRLADAATRAFTLVGLADRRKDKVRNYSGGMKRRLNLAAALLHDPKILLLDEPTVGVDPHSRNAIFENLEQLKKQGKAIVYTTHYMEEAERLCDRIVIIDHGRILADDTLPGLYRRLPAANVLEVDLDEAEGDVSWIAELRGLAGVKRVDLDGSTLRVAIEDLVAGAAKVLGWLNERSKQYSHVASQRADLETVFLTLTGRSLRDS
jgi:ABC-2 type transport system ATP-binding protein